MIRTGEKFLWNVGCFHGLVVIVIYLLGYFLVGYGVGCYFCEHSDLERLEGRDEGEIENEK